MPEFEVDFTLIYSGRVTVTAENKYAAEEKVYKMGGSKLMDECISLTPDIEVNVVDDHDFDDEREEHPEDDWEDEPEVDMDGVEIDDYPGNYDDDFDDEREEFPEDDDDFIGDQDPIGDDTPDRDDLNPKGF